MNPLEWITRKFETRPEPFQWQDPANKTTGVAIVHDDTQRVQILSPPEKLIIATFPGVSCVSALDLIAYLSRHARPSETIIFAGISGLSAVTDYCEHEGELESSHWKGSGLVPGPRARRVTMPAAWSPDCHQAMAQIEQVLGRWIGLDAMENLLDIAAPFVEEVAKVRDALFDLEGTEVVKVKRSAVANQVETGSTVQAKGSTTIPAEIGLKAVFMGRLVDIRIPLRVRAQGGKIEFSLINNGGIHAAKIAAVGKAAGALKEAGWFVIEGGMA